jgi:protein O-GlcNAc transferase
MQNTSQLLAVAQQYHQSGNLRQAEMMYRQILQADPAHADVWYLLGKACQAMGNFVESAAAFRHAIQLRPGNAEAHNELGITVAMQGQLRESLAHFQEALRLRPDYAFAYNNLGNVLRDLGNPSEAANCCRQALRLNPDYVEAYVNLGNALVALGRFDEAIDSIQRALRLRPDYAKAFNSLGLALAAQRKLPEAARCYEEAIRLQPKLVPAYFNAGNVYAEMRQLDKAGRWYQDGLRISPQQARAHINLGNIFLLSGKLDEAIGSYREAVRLQPDAAAHSNLLSALNYSPRMSPENLLAEHRLWETYYGQVQRLGPLSQVDRNPLRRLRVGYVSPDFRKHAVGFFFDPIVSNHDRRQFEVYCYAQEFLIDDLTRRFQSLSQGWRSTNGRSDQQVAEQIRADGIDILVDLAGHTANSRLRVFAFKPAPVQVTYLGYPNTTGLSAMDYRITDDVADPEREPVCHTEELVRLPASFFCYAPIPEAGEVTPPPCRKTGFFTFGSTHHLAKLNDSVLDVWCEILRAVPKSRLLVFRDTLTGKTKEETLQRFTQRGVSGDRILMDPPPGCEKSHFVIYNSIDLLLDAFPFTGHTTVVEALWMGVPAVTLAGNRFAARMAASVLTRVGLEELIARTPQQYVALAAQWADQWDRSENLRSSARERMRASPLCNGREFTQGLEEVYRKMWQTWCKEPRIQ